MNNQKKVLAILGPSSYLQEELFQEEGITCCYAYPPEQNIKIKILRRLFLQLGLENIFFQEINKVCEIDSFDIVIINEMIYPEKVIRYIRRYNEHCKIVYWLWNTVEFGCNWRGYNKWKQWANLLELRETYRFQIISFDEGDCQKYGLVFNNQIATYFKNIDRHLDYTYDVFFCGQDKGRLPLLINIADSFRSNGITYKFWILPDKRKKYSAAEQEYLLKRGSQIPYKEIIHEEMNCRAILDIVQNRQNGMTWRPLESLFYGKKLITNYNNIVKEPFYTTDNVFILNDNYVNHTNIYNLKEFLNRNMKKIESTIIKRYTINGWIENNS